MNGYLKLSKILSKSKRINGHSFNFGPKNNEIISVNKILKYISKDWPSFQWVKSNNIIKNETDLLVLNTTKAKKILNWNTRLSVKQATNLTIEWYKEFYKSKNNSSKMIDFTKKQIFNYHKSFIV